MSYLKTINIQHLTSGTNNIVLDANGNMTCAGTVSAGSSMGMRNRIINGDMRIDQRNAGASSTVGAISGTYYLDRWQGYTSQASKLSIQQNAGSVTPPAGFTHYMGFTSLSTYSSSASDYFFFRQVIEGLNCSDLAWGTSDAKPVTLSFWARSSLTGQFGGMVHNGVSPATTFYPFPFTINASNTWEYKTITIPGPTTGSWPTNTSGSIVVAFNLGGGSSRLLPANVWFSSSGGYDAPTGSVSLVGTNGATLYLTGIQFEVGTIATPFERRFYAQELVLCQRYYEASEFAVATARVSAITTVPFAWNYKVQKRTQPNVTVGYIAGNRVGTGPVTFANTISSAYYGTTKVDGVTWETTGDSTNIGTYNTIWSGIASAEL